MAYLNSALTGHYRCEESLARFNLTGPAAAHLGFFRFGPDVVCYGQLSSGRVARTLQEPMEDVATGVDIDSGVPTFPFDPGRVIDSLRLERYEPGLAPAREMLATEERIRGAYYFIRDLLPDAVRRSVQRAYFSDWKSRSFPAWPVDFTADRLQESELKLAMKAADLRRVPFIWFWPEGSPSCVILTHDVETSVGREGTSELMDLDESRGFKASFQVIPEKRYDVPDAYVTEIRSRGFEFNIHDLNHDGRLYRRREEFLRRAKKINQYAERYRARGFRAGSMYRIQEWYDAYDFSYDMSVPNVAHLEPKRGGCCTVFPYFVGKILELPLTTCQDYSVFHILRDYSLDLWKQQINMIRQRNGLISLLAHPDYLIDRRTRGAYATLLDYVRGRIDKEGLWVPLPGDLDRWWRARSEMKLVGRGSDWEITGPESHRARLAYAVLDGDRLVYELSGAAQRGDGPQPLSVTTATGAGRSSGSLSPTV